MISASRVQRRPSSCTLQAVPSLTSWSRETYKVLPHFPPSASEDGSYTVVHIGEKLSTGSKFKSLANQQNLNVPLQPPPRTFQDRIQPCLSYSPPSSDPQTKPEIQNPSSAKARHTIHAQLHVQHPKLRHSHNVLLRHATWTKVNTSSLFVARIPATKRVVYSTVWASPTLPK